MSAPSAVLRDALQAAGLLVGERGALPASVAGLTDDSRAVVAAGCFVAVRGSARDGHEFLPQVAAAGAALAVVAADATTDLPALLVSDTRAAAATLAAAYYGDPARQLTLVGVTGTNGKTTTVGLLRHLLDAPDAPSASIGTLGVLLGDGQPLPGGAGLTTPGPIELQRLLRALVDAGVRRVAMEVSSHALDQQRVGALRFAAGVFTNLTRDHLDYHGTMDAYLAAKARLVGLLADDGVAVVNGDDPAWRGLPPAPRTLRFGMRAEADLRAEELRFTPRGSAWLLRQGEQSRPVALPLIGEFNVANALGAAAAAIAVGVPFDTVAARLATVPQVPGRLELLGERPTVLRDYAHTPDALTRALAALRPFTPGRLIVLFGCGGDRDRGKRPLMATAARDGADHLVVTSDNPRTEDPERILDDICAPLAPGSYDRIEDRRAAIAHALALADPERDVVLLAGKGHETYQIRGQTSYPFDEAAIVRELLPTLRRSPA
ncbi:MAG: UDP-N-acetylmuramoyl-L-alanyl-D-glutamate--2,6-diaminopimelate ligase [Gemmatimonadaceae bacterium]|nr:UDP-N-acetylmuramoyl-L-alanyl-D-glutamate--2,6-diaminopimelate ligase [Gemmatimonadaceae bacterium]MCW5824948.1 UDP-N-acetylmuramoyl-L-alanyl-D-glutamate--2,6-diaminopimelate ligase [Gemmatimonadaceae bacterium]